MKVGQIYPPEKTTLKKPSLIRAKYQNTVTWLANRIMAYNYLGLKYAICFCLVIFEQGLSE